MMRKIYAGLDLFIYFFLFVHVLNKTKGLGKVTKINEVVFKGNGRIYLRQLEVTYGYADEYMSKYIIYFGLLVQIAIFSSSSTIRL